MTNDSLMPFGMYKGVRLGDVPAWYLLYQLQIGAVKEELEDYILRNKSKLMLKEKEDAKRRY